MEENQANKISMTMTIKLVGELQKMNPELFLPHGAISPYLPGHPRPSTSPLQVHLTKGRRPLINIMHRYSSPTPKAAILVKNFIGKTPELAAPAARGVASPPHAHFRTVMSYEKKKYSKKKKVANIIFFFVLFVLLSKEKIA